MPISIDPELQSQIPSLSEEEFRLLEESILSEGVVRDPLITWNGVLVDGHNRFAIIQKHSDIPIQYTTHEMTFGSRWEAICWICRNQLGRRNLSDVSRKFLIGQQYEAEKGARGGYHKSTEKSNCHSGSLISPSTANRLAKEHGIGERSVHRAALFARGVNLAEKISPGIREKILSGEIPAKEKDIESIPSATLEDQKILVVNLLRSSEKQKGKGTKTEQQKQDTSISAVNTNDNFPLSENREQPAASFSIESTVPEEEQMKYMLYELNGALNDFIKRWKDCTSIYVHLLTKKQIQTALKSVIQELVKFTKEIKEAQNGKRI